jgi:hypothetical protein
MTFHHNSADHNDGDGGDKDGTTCSFVSMYMCVRVFNLLFCARVRVRAFVCVSLCVRATNTLCVCCCTEDAKRREFKETYDTATNDPVGFNWNLPVEWEGSPTSKQIPFGG